MHLPLALASSTPLAPCTLCVASFRAWTAVADYPGIAATAQAQRLDAALEDLRVLEEAASEARARHSQEQEELQANLAEAQRALDQSEE